MPILHVAASAVVPAPAPIVYGIISDYHHGHPSILPRQYFEDLTVEAGGNGAGTRIRFTTRAYGSRRTRRATVTEPDPGRVLVETDEETGTPTRFVVEPLDGGAARVTFETDYRTAGVRGLIEALLVPRYLRAVYAAELQLLAQQASAAARGPGSN